MFGKLLSSLAAVAAATVLILGAAPQPALAQGYVESAIRTSESVYSVRVPGSFSVTASPDSHIYIEGCTPSMTLIDACNNGWWYGLHAWEAYWTSNGLLTVRFYIDNPAFAYQRVVLLYPWGELRDADRIYP